MDEKIFPSEIVHNTVEFNFVSNNRRFNRIYIALVLFVIITISALPFVNVKISSQSKGVIRSKYENVQIQSANYGLVKLCCIKEDIKVTKGDTLVVLDMGKMEEQIDQASMQVAVNISYIKDLASLIKDEQYFKTDKYRQEYLQYFSQLNEYDLNVELLEKEYLMTKDLFDTDVTPKMEYLKVKNAYETAVSKKQLFVKTTHNRWQSEISKLEIENKSLLSQSEQLKKEKRLYVITAPNDGVLYQTQGINTGSLIAPGQVLAYLSPDTELIVECYVSPGDIGFIGKDQRVSFQIDAFNYNQWGLAQGRVIGIAEDIVSYQDNPVFKVRCSLGDRYLQLKSGHKGYLKKGMTLNSRFYLTERSLFQLLYDKVDDWLNPKNV